MSVELTLIRDVAVMLRELLLQNIPDISVKLDFLDQAPPAGMGVSLFLYTVSENQYLKNQEFEQKGVDRLVHPPMMLDLFLSYYSLLYWGATY